MAGRSGSGDSGVESEPNEEDAVNGEPHAEPDEAAAASEGDHPMNPDDGGDAAEDEHPFPQRVPAPPFPPNVQWINTAGPVDLGALRGKFVLLDFWTYCCINCMHVLPELKKLERAFPRNVVVIGVHSAKFQTEEDTANIREAVLRYEIEHPVVNDSQHAIWNRYGARSWPTLVVIDPEGNVVARDSGEVPFEAMKTFFETALPYYRQRGLLDESELRFDLERYSAAQTPLRFPGKVLADPIGRRLFIADSNHNRVIITDLEGRLHDTIGRGTIGTRDGPFDEAEFNKPQGMFLQESMLYIADTENHLLRKVDLEERTVTTIAGTGSQGRGWPGLDFDQVEPLGRPKLPERWVGPSRKTALNSPWDLWIEGETLYIAMAGPHQIWFMPLDESQIGIYAGNGREDIVDGPLVPKEPYQTGYCSFAQPSGLASDGQWLYVADSEGSSIRRVPFDPAGQVDTLLGTAHLPAARLFTFGDVDGQGEAVRLQHPLGVVFHEGRLYVADTYNNKIKVVDVEQRRCMTLAGTGEAGMSDDPPMFDEPAGLAVAEGKLYVADTNNHAIRVIELDKPVRVRTLEIAGLGPPKVPAEMPREVDAFAGVEPISLELQRVRPQDGELVVRISLQLEEGYKLNELAPVVYRIRTPEPAGPVDRGATGKMVRLPKQDGDIEIRLPLINDMKGRDVAELALGVYYCRSGAEGVCKAASFVWRLPVEIDTNATSDALMCEARLPPD